MLEGCVLLDQSIPDLRGDFVHFTSITGGKEMQVAMSRHEARKMASKVIRLLDAAESAQMLRFDPSPAEH